MEAHKPERLEYSDKRITTIILNHWESAKGSAKFPSEKHLDPEVLEQVLDSCFLIRTEGLSEGKYNYKFLGKNIMEAYGSDITQPLSSSKTNPLTQKDKIEEVLIRERPVTDSGSFINKNGHVIKYRQCLVPLSSDGRKIDSVFGGMRFKVEEPS